MNLINTIAIAMGAGWVSGINLYAAVATLGLLSRFAHLRLPGELDVVTNWWIIGIALALYVVEFFADKIPYLDSAWDAIHTFIRIPAGAVLAASSFGEFDRSVQVVAFLLGGSLALSSHGTKASARAAINLSPEPVTNIAASLAEDALAVGSIILSVFVPVALIVLVVVFVGFSIYMIPRTVRALRAAFARVRGMWAYLSKTA